MGTFSIWHWLIVLVVVVLVFGTKKLGNLGSDLGKAVKGFKEGVKTDEDEQPMAKAKIETEPAKGETIEGEVKEESKS